MKLQRRTFINQLSVAAAALAVARPVRSAAAISNTLNNSSRARNRVTIYHTGNLTGKVRSTLTGGNGLLAVRSFLKEQEMSGLLFDTGNFLPANYAGSSKYEMISLMNQMGYQVAAIGEHELSEGQDALAKLIPSMNFKLVNCNYRFNGALNNLVLPYTIIYSGNYKIGVTSVGDQASGTGFKDPSVCANDVARILKEKEKCDLVVCLSRLSFSLSGDAPDTKKLASKSEHIDLVIVSSKDTPANTAHIVLNQHKKEVLVCTAIPNGLGVGKTSFGFFDDKQKNDLKAKHFLLG